jgi:hypothetical protein
MTHLVLVIDIDGDVDQPGLERLRTHLNLKKQGRLTDDWDQEFGYRVIEAANGQRTDVGLWREFDESWKVSVLATSQPDPTNDELAPLRTELVEGITAAGFQATVRAKPTFGGKP